MPRDPVSLDVPLYPNATATGTTPDVWYINRPFTPYEKTAVAKFDVPVGLRAAYHWYLKSLAVCGYRKVDVGSATKRGHSAMGMYFQGTTLPNEDVSVSLTADGANSASVLYYGLAVSLPTRPASTYITIRPVRVNLTYFLSDGRHYWKTSTVNQSEIQWLVGAFNSNQEWGNPKYVGYLVRTCFTPENLGHAKVAFVARSGRKQTFFVDYSCARFWSAAHPKQPIDDYDRAVWYAVTSGVYEACRQHACRLLRS